ncbi:PEP-CTERM sorting domain-containing protein [Geomonas oryzisoli]|uniref:PEP-CTERM sorting domain-containing protein n=1 Tax=Geomonas oryzisoli TaxID=2847992 RepID=A0ABX8J8K9_9BACT|nr:PEP-CTERM sorting domain-containing protein [Geomonas oryzisoli]QWV91860.1 PEP-CTERM sorting domain-containing protein [Geomonas oryzisoli]
MKGFAALVAGALLFMATGAAQGSYITLSNSELLTATVIGSNNQEEYGGWFKALDYTPTGTLFIQNMSRPMAPGALPYYVYSYVGVDAARAGKSDLTGVDSFELRLANVNNSPWELALFVQADGATYLSDYQVVPNQKNPVDMKNFSFDLSLLGPDRTDVEYLGFAVRSMLDYDPSNPDAYHVLAAPVPEPGTVLLLGTGIFGLAIYGKRRKRA